VDLSIVDLQHLHLPLPEQGDCLLPMHHL
jgi:hypothetical protein